MGQQNPFAPASADVERSYHGVQDGRFVKLWPQAGAPDPAAVLAHESFRGMVLSEPYPCLLSRGVMRREDYRFGAYPALGSAAGVRAAAADLWQFIQDFPIQADHFASFVATFDGPVFADEEQFEDVLWTHLQMMHEIDREHHDWSTAVGSDPNVKGFSFSFSGRAFFIVGMHPASSRWARRPARPTLVFNAHEQFNILREDGRMGRLTGAIRNRDEELQGTINPALHYFDGDNPETVMYSGRRPTDDWKCPMHIAPRQSAVR